MGQGPEEKQKAAEALDRRSREVARLFSSSGQSIMHMSGALAKIAIPPVSWPTGPPRSQTLSRMFQQLNVNSHRPPFDNHPPPLLHPPPLPSPTLHCCPPLAFMSQPQSRLTRLPLLSNRRKAPRGKGGLVHGTGRVKSNGTIRRSDSNSSKKPTSKPAPVKPSKQRLVVKQGPTPLYCSDECRLADLNASRSIAGSDYNPDHQSPLPPSVPHNSFPFLAFSASQDSEDDSSSSTDSLVELIDADRCHACLASL